MLYTCNIEECNVPQNNRMPLIAKVYEFLSDYLNDELMLELKTESDVKEFVSK